MCDVWRSGLSVCLDPICGTTYRRTSDSLLRYTHSMLLQRNICLCLNKPTPYDMLNSVSWNAHKQLDLLHVNVCVSVCVCVYVFLFLSGTCVCLSCDILLWYIHWLFLFSFIFIVMCHKSFYGVGTLNNKSLLLCSYKHKQEDISIQFCCTIFSPWTLE